MWFHIASVHLPRGVVVSDFMVFPRNLIRLPVGRKADVHLLNFVRPVPIFHRTTGAT